MTSIWQRLTGNTAAANNHNNDAVRPAELIVRQDDVGRLEDNGVPPAQGDIIAGDFLRDIARQPGSTAMLRDDDVIRQPAAALQNGILRHPVELQDNTAVDLLDTVTDQRMQLFVDETTLDFTYWNSYDDLKYVTFLTRFVVIFFLCLVLIFLSLLYTII